MYSDYAIHSDFLIHWTGKPDIDQYDPRWYESEGILGKTPSNVIELYLQRIITILEYGLWMTEGVAEIPVNASSDPVPPADRTCFTELRLSLSMRHAKEYGRLGIGVKRGFLFERRGRPVIYYGWDKEDPVDDFASACALELKNKRMLHFFKPMNRTTMPPLKYEFYAESEWRVIYDEALKSDALVKDPRDHSNTREFSYHQSLCADKKAKLKYLIPLDGWFAMLIYPSLDVKNAARDDGRVHELIRKIKDNKKDHANKIEGGNWPIEVCLFDTVHF